MAAVRFAVEGVRDGVPVITMEHITRLTPASAPDWEYPPDGKTGVHRVVVEGEPRVELNTHVSHPVLDVTEADVSPPRPASSTRSTGSAVRLRD